jgi:hypothetical protein
MTTPSPPSKPSEQKPQPLHWLNIFSLWMIAGITLWLCIGSTYRWDNNPAHNRANFYGPAELARKLHHLPNPGGTNREEQVKLLYERLSPIFDQRLEQYKANLQAEDGYIWYMLLFTAAAASLLAVRGSSIKVPILEDVKVPLLWVYARVPGILVDPIRIHAQRTHRCPDCALEIVECH